MLHNPSTTEVMRRWPIAVVCVGLLLGGFAAYRRYHLPPTTVVAPPLEEAERDAATVGNRLVSSRHLPEGVQPPADVPLWKALTPWTDSTLLAEPSTPVDEIVVYVHGYNTPLASVVASGNILARELSLLAPSAGGSRLFFSFCWRGDFATLQFGRSDESAAMAGASLADFLQRLFDARVAAGQPRIIVLAHSLGSRVALVAVRRLWEREHRTRLEHLVLVQPAVPLGDLYVGRVDTFLSPLRARESGAADGWFLVSQRDHRGPYVDSLGIARHVIITKSSADGVLNTAYRSRRYDYASATAYRSFPDLNTALGLPRGAEEKTPTHYREMNLVDLVPAGARSHSGLYTGKEFIALLWRTMTEDERRETGPGRVDQSATPAAARSAGGRRR